MTSRPTLLLCAVPALLLAACASTPTGPQIPSLKSRQSSTWLKSAIRLRAGRYTVYCHGTIEYGPTARPGHWNGTVYGDIFAASPHGYLVIPDGTLSLTQDNQLTITGLHRTVTF